MPNWLTRQGVAVPNADPANDSGLMLKKNLNILGLRSAGVLAPCRAAADANVATLNGTSTPIDGVTLAAGDRVLLTNQSNRRQNGPWVVASGPWTRPADFARGMVFTTGGLLVSVIAGSTYGGRQYEIGVFSMSGFPASGAGTLMVDTSFLAVVPPATGYVSNPMTSDLDGGGNDITDLNTLAFVNGGTIADSGAFGGIILTPIADPVQIQGNLSVNGSFNVSGSAGLDGGAIMTDGSGNLTVNALANASGFSVDSAGNLTAASLSTPIANGVSQGLFSITSDVGNATTALTLLTTDGSSNTAALPAGIFTATGNLVVAKFFGIFANHSGISRQMWLYFGPNGDNTDSLIFDSGTQSPTGAGAWVIEVTVICTTYGFYRAIVECLNQSTGVSITTQVVYTNLASVYPGPALIFSLYGQAGTGGANNDIVLKAARAVLTP